MSRQVSSSSMLDRVLASVERLRMLPVLASARRALALPLPLIMIGAFTLLLEDPPIAGLAATFDATFGPGWRATCDIVVASTFGIASLVTLIGYGSARTELHNQALRHNAVSPTVTIMVLVAGLFVVAAPTDDKSLTLALSMNKGLLVAITVAALGAEIFLRLAQVGWLRVSSDSAGYDLAIRDVVETMPAAVLTVLGFACVRSLASYANAADLQTLFPQPGSALFREAGNNVVFATAYSALCQILWFFGIHGPNFLFSVEDSVLVPASLANSAAPMSHVTPPFIFTKQFFDAFTRMGGSGGTLSLILAVLIAGRDRSCRRFAVAALIPAVCNVNEPLLFGMPLVFNPVYVVPFVFVPLLQTLLAWAATVLDLVPHTTVKAGWTTPALLSGFVVTGSITGTLMQVVNLSIGALMYVPFVRLDDASRQRRNRTLLGHLLHVAEGLDRGLSGRKLLDLPGEFGRASDALAEDLKQALAKHHELFLEYQPQMNAAGTKVHGVEALLRWNHPVFGRIPPPITIALAEDSGQIAALGDLILKMACRQRMVWNRQFPTDLVMSVNVSPRQLDDPDFDTKVLAALAETGVAPRHLELEITESTIIVPNPRSIECLQRIRAAGIRIALDDFGMGHTSLRYIRELPIDTVKIDRSFTMNDQGRIDDHIVRSIIELSQSLGIATIIEGVEKLSQLARFTTLGCTTFQGYLFSRPLGPDLCLAFIREIGEQQERRDQPSLPEKQEDRAVACDI